MNDQQHRGTAGDPTPGRPALTTTFSGAHPYRPQCVRSTALGIFTTEGITGPLAEELALSVAGRITAAIDAGVCPRCGAPLTPDSATGGWKPAGSRALPCRCVPVCETCAGWIEPVRGPLPVTCWPTSGVEMDDGRTLQEDEATLAAQLIADHPPVAVDVLGLPSGPALLTDAGITVIQPRPNPGGWLEYGYDDTDDVREVGR